MDKYLNERSLGKVGVERVRKFLHKQVDLYIDGEKGKEEGLMPESDVADDAFYVRDFYQWFRRN